MFLSYLVAIRQHLLIDGCLKKRFQRESTAFVACRDDLHPKVKTLEETYQIKC